MADITAEQVRAWAKECYVGSQTGERYHALAARLAADQQRIDDGLSANNRLLIENQNLQNKLRGEEARVTALEQERDEARAIVDRVWKALGIATYEGARGKSIWEIVAEHIEARRTLERTLEEVRHTRDRLMRGELLGPFGVQQAGLITALERRITLEQQRVMEADEDRFASEAARRTLVEALKKVAALVDTLVLNSSEARNVRVAVLDIVRSALAAAEQETKG